MALRPKPDASAAHRAAERIIERRRVCDDPDRDRIPDHPFGVAQYATSHLHIPAAVAARDIADVTIILDWQATETDKVRLASLRARTVADLSFSQLAKVLGLSRRQDAENWQTRLVAAVDERKPKREQNVRPGRRQVRVAEAIAQTHAQKLRALTVALLEQKDAMPDDVADDFYVEELEERLSRWPADMPPPSEAGVVNALRFLLGQLVDAQLPQGRLDDLTEVGVALVGVRREGLAE